MMTQSRVRAVTLFVMAFAVAAALTAGPVLAQQRPNTPPAQGRPAAQPPAQAPQPPPRVSGHSSGWGKICPNPPQEGRPPTGCLVTQETISEQGTFLASLAIQEGEGDRRRQLLAIVPLGIALQSGVLMRVDDQRAFPAKIGTCLPNGCVAGLDLGDDLLRPMRQGSTFFVTIRTAQGVPADLALPLEGLNAAIEGPALDAAQLQERQRRMQDEAVRRQERAREQAQAEQERARQQQGGAPPPGSAPASPASPPGTAPSAPSAPRP